jgi:hypothetical protein
LLLSAAATADAAAEMWASGLFHLRTNPLILFWVILQNYKIEQSSSRTAYIKKETFKIKHIFYYSSK